MDISIFDVLGPIMMGPSSSHTAGAARLARVATKTVPAPFKHVKFGLHGSFAETYKGHGTDKALVAGILGLESDDEKIADAFDLAAEKNITYEFYPVELDGYHANSVKMTFILDNDDEHIVIGSSLGGGEIMIREINGYETEFPGRGNTIIIRQRDLKGIVSDVSTLLAQNDINIGVMKLSRKMKGDIACCIIEADSYIEESVVEEMRKLDHVLSVQAINL